MLPESSALSVLGAPVVGPMTPSIYRVQSRVEEIADTITLTLEPVDDAIAAPAPGQFNMLWAFGIGEAPISIAATDGAGLTHTIRSVGAVTIALSELEVDAPVGVRGPFGTGWDLAGAKGNDVLVVAGGLGSAPLRPIVQEVLANREDYGRLAVLIGARSPEALLYQKQFEQWGSRSDMHLAVTVDSASPSWRGDVGLVTRLVDRAPIDFASATTFVCGPEIMMRFAAQAVVERGASPSKVYLSLERNMHCAIGHCGHCQLGPAFLCKDGPVLAWSEVEPLLAVRAR